MSTDKYNEIDIYSFIDVWNRVLIETDIKNQNDLANIVGVSQGAISSRKSKDVWPEEWAYRIGKKYNLLTEWILTGEGPKRLKDTENSENYKLPILTELDQWLNDLVINEPYRKDWFRGTLEDAFPLFKEWIKRKEYQKQQEYDNPNDDGVKKR